MRALDVLETLELLGSQQRGLVTAAQAQEAGVSKMMLSRLAGRGTLQRVRQGVYSLPSAQGGPHRDLRAAWLAAGASPEMVVSGESAAALHGLGDVLPSRHEFTTATRRQTTQPDVRYRKKSLPGRDVTSMDGLPVTSVSRTVSDLATGGTDFDHLAGAVRDAVEEPGTTPSLLTEALDPAAAKFGYQDGSALLAALLKSTGYRPDTTLVELLPSVKFMESFSPHLQSVISQEVAEQMKQAFVTSGLLDQLAKSALPTDVMERGLAELAGYVEPLNERLGGALTRMFENVQLPPVPSDQDTHPRFAQRAQLDAPQFFLGKDEPVSPSSREDL